MDNMRQIMGMTSVLNLIQTYSYSIYDPSGAGNFVTIGITIAPNVDSSLGPEISAKQALLNLLAARTEQSVMNTAVNPYNYDPQRAFGGTQTILGKMPVRFLTKNLPFLAIHLLRLPNEVASYEFYGDSLNAKRSTKSANIAMLRQEEPQRRDIVNTFKRYVLIIFV